MPNNDIKICSWYDSGIVLEGFRVEYEVESNLTRCTQAYTGKYRYIPVSKRKVSAKKT